MLLKADGKQANPMDPRTSIPNIARMLIRMFRKTSS